MRYAEEQLWLEQDRQYRGTVSPPITLILTVALIQCVDLAVEGKLTLFAMNPVFETPKLASGWRDEKKQAERIAHLVWLRPWLGVPDSDIGKCHDSLPFPQRGPTRGPR
jgi:hypothetical protein